jgi:5'-nucleotidase
MKKSKPLIVLTNDDGVESPGLLVLAKTLDELGEVIIVAPTKQQTAAGRSIYGKHEASFTAKEISIIGSNITAYHCDCSPAQLISHAINVIFIDRKPDLVVSGINYGENLGTNVTYSGTIGAALEAACFGIPSIAVSLETLISNHRVYADVDWAAACYFTKIFCKKMLNTQLPFDVDLLKIDVPEDADENTEVRVTRVSRQGYFSAKVDSPTLNSKLGDREVYISIDKDTLEPDSDVYAVLVDRVVSVSPISIDMTARVDINELKNILTGLK